jgi:serine/threonine-protein kinase
MIACSRCNADCPDSVKYCPQCGLRIERAEVAEDPLVGVIFDDRYEVLSKVASGGFGTVYRVRNLELDTIEALKVLHPHVASRPKQIRRFRQDAQLLRELAGHTDYVPKLHHFDQDEERRLWYFTLEFLDGISLHQLLLESGVMEPDRTIAIMRQICAALTVAHSHDPPVVHRDLKPDNIFLLDRNGRDLVKILDFGIAKKVGHDSLTEVGQGLGSYGYMPPEQYLGENIDARTDLFAAGVILYNMLTEHEPWLGRKFGLPSSQSTQLRAMDAMLNKPPVPPREARPDLTADIEAVVLRLLEKDPALRFQSAADLDKALQRLQLTVGVPSGGSLRVESVPAGAAVLLKRQAAVVAKGRTPWEIGPLPPGEYELRVRAKYCQPAQARVRIVEDETSHVKIPLERTASPSERFVSGLTSVGVGARKGLGGVASGVRGMASLMWRAVAGIGRGFAGAGRAAGGGLAGVASAAPWRRVTALSAIVLILGGGTYLVVGPLRAPLANAADWIVDLFTPPQTVTAGLFFGMAENGEISELRVTDDGSFEALRNTASGEELIRVDWASTMGFQELLRRARQADVRIRARGGSARLAVVAQQDGPDGAPAEARVSLRSDVSPGCSPCDLDTGEELTPGWYAVQNDSEEWIVLTTDVRSTQGTREPLNVPDTVYLAGGLNTEIRMILTSRTGLRADSLLQAARDAIDARRYRDAVVVLSQVDQLDPGNSTADGLISEVANEWAADAQALLDGRRLAQARDTARACMDLLPSHDETCRDLVDLAVVEIRRLERERAGQVAQTPPPPPVSPPGDPPDSARETERDTGPDPEEPPEEVFSASYLGSWNFYDTFDDAGCSSGPHPFQLEQTTSGVSGQATLLERCGTTGQSRELRIAGSIQPDGVVLGGRRGDHDCTYRADPAGMSSTRIIGTVECEVRGSGRWRLLRR